MASFKDKKKNKSQDIGSYFYSTRKDNEGNVKFDYKKFGKESFKWTKYAVYLFLLVVSLWGCFQSFVITTNPQLGYGFETYASYADVYANNYTYQANLIIPVDEIKGYVSSEDSDKDFNGDGEDEAYIPNLRFYSGLPSEDNKEYTPIENYMNSTNVVFYYEYASAALNTSIEVEVDTDNDDESISWYEKAQESEANAKSYALDYKEAVEAFLYGTSNSVGAQIYLTPSPNNESIAPSNIAFFATQDVRTDGGKIAQDEWATSSAKDDERIDRAGWTMSVRTTNSNLNNYYSQTEFSNNSATPVNATIEEYFMVNSNSFDTETGLWEFEGAGAYTQSGSFKTSIDNTGLNSYAIAADLPDYTGNQDIDDVKKQQDLIAQEIANNGLVAKDVADLNSRLGNPFNENGDEKQPVKGTTNNGENGSIVFATPFLFEPEITNPDDTEDIYNEAEEQLLYIPFGGLFTYDRDSGSEGKYDYLLSSSFNYTNEGSNVFTTDKQMDNRNIVVTWSDAWEYGPFYGLFVWPIAQFSLWVSSWIPWASFGAWSAVLGVLFIIMFLRIISTLVTVNKFTSQAKTQEIQLKTAEVNAKYAIYDKKNTEMKRKKQAETMAVYKKEGVSPYGAIGTMLITMPIFLAMWRVISALPAYKIGEIAGVGFGESTLAALFGGAAAALLIMIPVVFVQYVSFKAPTWLAKKRKGVKHLDEKTKKAMKKSNKVANIMGIVFIVIGVTIPTLLAIYWVISGVYTIFISYLQHLVIIREAENAKLERMGTSRKEEIEKGNILTFKQKLSNRFKKDTDKIKPKDDILEDATKEKDTFFEEDSSTEVQPV